MSLGTVFVVVVLAVAVVHSSIGRSPIGRRASHAAAASRHLSVAQLVGLSSTNPSTRVRVPAAVEHAVVAADGRVRGGFLLEIPLPKNSNLGPTTTSLHTHRTAHVTDALSFPALLSIATRDASTVIARTASPLFDEDGRATGGRAQVASDEGER